MENLTPPPELVRAWNKEAVGTHFPPYGYSEFIATRAAQWGANQELDACCERLTLTHGQWELAADLRAARRPKPQSLAEEALALLQPGEPRLFNGEMQDTLRRALKRLQELEEQQ